MGTTPHPLTALFPLPKHLSTEKGESRLSRVVTLQAESLHASQKKCIRGVLTAAGVKVVSRKTACIIQVAVTSPEEFNLEQVPANARQDYYELHITGGEIVLRAPYLQGTTWGAQTLACIFRHFIDGETVPNIHLCDWPSFPYRGIFVENKWGTDRMTLQDWKQTVDTIAALKMNILGIGLYGCWGNCRFEGGDKPTEFLMVPVKGHPTLKNTHFLRWFSPAENAWKEEYYKAFLAENNMLAKVVKYADSQGVTIVPFVNSFGHNTLIPRLLPKLSAKDAEGNPTGVGYCLSNPELKQFITEFYGGIIQRYFPNGCKFFHIQMDEVWPDHPSLEDPTKIGSPWCECPECKAHKQEDMLKQYILWIAKMLIDKGVEKVFVWNDQLTRHMDALDGQFAKDLETAGLKDRLIIDWWNYSNTEIREKTHVRQGKELGLDGVVSPMTCYYNWFTYSNTLPNIAMMMKMAHDEGALGTISYAVHSPSHIDHEALMAAYAWETLPDCPFQDIVTRWAKDVFRDKAEDYLKAVDIIRKSVTNPVYPPCFYYQYTYAGNTWPRSYLREALDKFQAMGQSPTPADTLETIANDVKKATEILEEIIQCNSEKPTAVSILKALQADALRIRFNARAFACLLKLQKEPAKVQATTCDKLYKELIQLFAQMESTFPAWLAPSALHDLSPLLQAIDEMRTKQ